LQAAVPVLARWRGTHCDLERQLHEIRLPRLLPWLAERVPDVLLLQETKSNDEAWPGETFRALGYDSAHLARGAGTGWRCCPALASST